METPWDLTGQVVLVTGGSRGMGAAMVEAFARAGATTVIASRKRQACEALAESVRQRTGERSLALPCNVSDWDQCDQLVDRVYAELGRIDVLVNNAGLSPVYDNLTDIGEALFDKVIAVNLKGPFRLSARIGERMVTDGGGAIINITSTEATRPQPNALPYAAAKAGLNTLTEGLARALAPTVRVNAIQAGPFLTDIATAWTDQMRASLESRLALGRCGDPEEIVGAALYFASTASSFATGAVLRLDGGMD